VASLPDDNEGFDVLDEVVFQAIPDPSFAVAGGAGFVRNGDEYSEGILMMEEFVFNASSQRGQDGNAVERTAGTAKNEATHHTG
jgi:hypothetical protein